MILNSKKILIISISIILAILLGLFYSFYKIIFNPYTKNYFDSNIIIYTNIINNLNKDGNLNIISLGENGVTLKNKENCEFVKKECFEKYKILAELMKKIDKNTYFNRCNEDIIKITIHNSFRPYEFQLAYEYVYSKKGFSTLPKMTEEKLNNYYIIYTNPNRELSSEWTCILK